MSQLLKFTSFKSLKTSIAFSLFAGFIAEYKYRSVSKLIRKFNSCEVDAYCFNTKTLNCFKAKDKEIIRVEGILNDLIKKLEFKHQGNLNRQTVHSGIRGNQYYLEFTINQANVNPDALLNKFLSVVNPKTMNKNNNKTNFVIVDQAKFEEDDLYTIKINFETPSNSVALGKNKGSLYIRGTFGQVYDNFVVSLEKQNDYNDIELNGFIAMYEEAFSANNFKRNNPTNTPNNSNFFGSFFNNAPSTPGKSNKEGKDSDPLSVLSKNGVMVFQPGQEKSKNLEWNYLAGYEKEKRLIEDSILLSLTHGEVYDQITQGTRVKFETNRPRAILFDGPPGCGKTTSAKIIANQVNIPLVYMPLEAIMSKWYGESENKFSEIFEAAKALGKSIIFIDEVDALATSREGDIHEASRRILSTLLRKIDGFESDGDVLLICATNRRKDLDAALLSRLDITITFDLPDSRARALIFQKYAKQLNQEELEKLASLSERFSGRDIADVCKDAERRWASKYIRKETSNLLPDINMYNDCLKERKSYMNTKI